MTADAQRSARWAEELADDHGLELRRWFGGWSLRSEGRQVAIVLDTVYVRADRTLREELDATGLTGPFRYHRADGREIEVDAYRAVPASVLRRRAARDRLFRRVIEALDRSGDTGGQRPLTGTRSSRSP